MSARDFVVNIIYNKEPDGTIYSVASSSNVKLKVEPVKGVVRAEQPIRGQMFKVDPNDPNKTYMTIVNELDLKGAIPDWVLRAAFKDQGYIIDRLRKTLPKWKAMFPGDRP